MRDVFRGRLVALLYCALALALGPVTVDAAAVSVVGISPNGGPTAGGTTVSISGSGFTSASAVNFGNTPAASFTIVSDVQITAASPASSTPGGVDVTVVAN